MQRQARDARREGSEAMEEGISDLGTVVRLQVWIVGVGALSALVCLAIVMGRALMHLSQGQKGVRLRGR
jgi:hypothetical protein